MWIINIELRAWNQQLEPMAGAGHRCHESRRTRSRAGWRLHNEFVSSRQMIDSSAAAPPLLLQLVLQQQTKLTGIDVVEATKEALKMKKKLKHNEAQ